MILAIQTDSMNAFIGLYDEFGNRQKRDQWEAGRALSKDLLRHLDALVDGKWETVDALVVYRGPGSFTSLRIGITTANTIAYAQSIPIVGSEGEAWLKDGINRLASHHNDGQVLPLYGADPHITAPKK